MSAFEPGRRLALRRRAVVPIFDLAPEPHCDELLCLDAVPRLDLDVLRFAHPFDRRSCIIGRHWLSPLVDLGAVSMYPIRIVNAIGVHDVKSRERQTIYCGACMLALILHSEELKGGK